MIKFLLVGISLVMPFSLYADKAHSKECQLRLNMRQLWEDHAIYTREYIIDFLENKPNVDLIAQRLLENQDQIGQAIVPFYGEKAGQQLSKLLREHILIAVELVKAAKKGDSKKFAEIDRQWRKNGEDIAQFLHTANPKNWPLQALTDMMYNHLNLTEKEVSLRLQKNWKEDIKNYDAVRDQLLHMGEALSDGIIAQFKQKF